MRKIVLSAMFAVVSLFCNAQFVLTPSAGLVTEDGAYTIMREGTESENYYAAKKAVEAAIPDANIGELDYEKSFVSNITYKTHDKLPGALVATDWVVEHKIKVEATEGKILISFEHAGNLEVWKKGELFLNLYPLSGKNSMLGGVGGVKYVFNSKGQVAKGCKKVKDIYESIANSIVRNIENNLK